MHIFRLFRAVPAVAFCLLAGVSNAPLARAWDEAGAPPIQADASQQQAPLPPLAVTQLDDRSVIGTLDERTISLRFSEPLPIQEVLLLLFRDTPFSIVPDPDVQGTFIGELRDLTLRQALDLVLHPLGLDYAVQDATIRVFRQRVDTRIFDVNYVVTRRTAQRSVTAPTSPDVDSRPSGGAPGSLAALGTGENTTRVTSVDESDLFEELSNGLRTLLSERGRFNLDRKAGLLQVSDLPDRLDRVTLYLEAVQARVQRQVQIQAKVIEVELDEPFEVGIDWTELQRDGRNGVLVTQAPAPGEPTVVRGPDLDELVTRFSMQGRVNVLASPRVIAMNNEPAVMKMGIQDVFFVTTSERDPATGRMVQSAVPQTVIEGVVLTVTPQISPDGMIHMSITPRVTERTGEAKSRSGDPVPVMRVRETDTVVRVREGDTIVIAGLMQDRIVKEESGTPLFGSLFRRTKRTTTKSDLVVLLSPSLIAPGDPFGTRLRDAPQHGAPATGRRP